MMRNFMKSLAGGFLALGILTMGACGASPADTQTGSQPKQSTAADITCQDVDLAAADIVGTGGEPGDFKASKAVAAKAPDRGNAWLMAIEFTPSDGGDPVDGVFMTSGVTAADVAPIMAVDGYAQQFSHWPSSFQGEKLSISETGAQQVLDCLAN